MNSSAPAPRVVLDTDTFNEVDDQFALAHLLLSPKELKLEAVHAAPFLNTRSTSPADGMEKSYKEIHRVLDLVQPAQRPQVCRGSTAFLKDATTPAQNDAVENLIRLALNPQIESKKEKLVVVGIAAATNIASALLLEPQIIHRITVVWLGGHASYWPTTREFNLKQDIHAARILFESGVELIHMPCNPVASHLTTTVAELREQLAPFSKLGTYLTDIVTGYAGNPPGWSKVIWDIAATAWAIHPQWVTTREIPSPRLLDDMTWSAEPAQEKRHRIRETLSLDRNGIFADFFAKAKTAGR
jgi:purine nucleosidase